MNSVTWKIRNIKTGKILDISKSVFSVGRSVNADLTSINTVLSRNQATLSVSNDGCLSIQDNKSCNGTFVNNQKIPAMEMRLLNHRDIIGFGICQDMSDDQVSDESLIFEVLKCNTDISVSGAMKEEQDITTELHANGFSKESISDCIIVSEEEDNDTLITNSQIFKLSEKIKDEQTSFSDSVDPYAHIKQELEDLDYCDNSGNIIDLTNDCDRFDSTCELINILESPIHNNTIEKSDCSSKVSTSKYVKPPIIEPHFYNKITSKERSKLSKVDDTNLTRKRKHINENPELKKKSKTINLLQNNCNKKHIEEEFKKRNKRKNSIKEEVNKKYNHSTSERRKKLKEITGKVKCSNKIVKTSTSPSKIKMSKARGNFLLNENEVTTTINNDNHILSIPSTSSSALNCSFNSSIKSKDRESVQQNALLNKCDQDSQIQDTTVSSNCSPENYKSTSNVFNSLTLFNKNTNSKKYLDCNSPKYDNESFHLTSTSTSNKSKSIINSNKMVDIDAELCQIVGWSVKWLREQKNFDISPPVNGERQLLQIPLSYNSCADYYNIITPLIMLELWQYVYQSLYNKDEQRTPISIFLSHKRIVGNLTYLDCECYITKESIQKNNIIRTDDLALIELKLKDTENCYTYNGFGYIKSCRRVDMKDDMIINDEVAKLCPNVPHTNLKFTVITRNLSGKEISSKAIVLKVISNIASYLRLIKTAKHINVSPICSQILNPNIKDYIISTEEMDLCFEINLNSYQKKVVLEASSLCLRNEPGLYLIKGPPGTGKSTVIVNIVLQILFRNIKYNRRPPLILLTAPSNAAVDNLIVKLAEVRTKLSDYQKKHLKLVRIGPDSSISKNVDKFKLTTLAANHVLKENGLINSEEYKDALQKGVNIQQFLKKRLGKKYWYEIKSTEDTLLFGSNVICTTLNSCVSSRILDPCRRNQLHFSCCIVDEANQCGEMESLLPIQLGIDKFILVGDPKQLPAVVQNKDAQKLGYGKSLFARIDENFRRHRDNPIRMLCEQYRMKQEICDYPNKSFYDGKLTSFPIHTNQIKPEIEPYLLFNLMLPENPDNSHYKNLEEAHFIYNLLYTLHNIIKHRCKYSIGIITPYKAQKDVIIKTISNIRFNPNVSITVNTIDSFQGLENDVVVISCVRYNPNNFLQNEQRLNVALTRARQALYIIGNYTLFKHCRLLYDLREDAKKRKLCFDINKTSKDDINLYKYLIRK